MGKRKVSRNAFNDCEREYNRKEEAIEMARKDQLDEQGRLNAMGQEREARLMAELAEVKRESLKLSALVVERDYQITLANKGYDYEGAVEDSRHYKEMAEKYKAELAAYKADARRYRWLKSSAECSFTVHAITPFPSSPEDTMAHWFKGPATNLDAAIDAAIKGNAT